MSNYPDVSRRDVGAGITAGAGRHSLCRSDQPRKLRPDVQGPGFDSASIAEYRRGTAIISLAIILTPIIAVFVGTVVWRLLMPDEPNPRYGAVAGVVSAVGSLIVFAASMGLVGSLSQFSAGALGAVAELLYLTAIIVLFGVVIAGPYIIPLGALVGYGYERYIDAG